MGVCGLEGFAGFGGLEFWDSGYGVSRVTGIRLFFERVDGGLGRGRGVKVAVSGGVEATPGPKTKKELEVHFGHFGF